MEWVAEKQRQQQQRNVNDADSTDDSNDNSNSNDNTNNLSSGEEGEAGESKTNGKKKMKKYVTNLKGEGIVWTSKYHDILIFIFVTSEKVTVFIDVVKFQMKIPLL